MATFMLSNVGGAGPPVLERARIGAAFLGDGIRSPQSLAENHYRATDELADRLGLGMDVRESLRQDVTLQGVRVQISFPMDADSDALLRRLALPEQTRVDV